MFPFSLGLGFGLDNYNVTKYNIILYAYILNSEYPINQINFYYNLRKVENI